VRIVLSCPYSLSRPGGVQGQVRGLARSLRRAGHDVTVLAPDDDRPPGLHDGTLVVGHSVGIRANGSIAPLALSPQSLWRTGRFVRRVRPDVVHLHEPLAPASGYGCFLQAGVPLVGTFHRSGESSLYRALGPLGRLAAGRLDAACCVSEAAGETARAMLGVDCEVLFNGVEVDRFARTTPVAHPGPTVLFLGRHEARKGLGILLEAFTRLPPPAVLWIAGDGPLTGALSGRYPGSGRIVWLGVLDEEALAARLAAADVLCAPSLAGESFGMVLLEAMAARTAVVASDLTGYRAAAGGQATLVPPGDPVALAAALADALTDASRGTGRSSPTALDAAADRANEWSMERLARHYEDIYLRVRTARGSAGGAVA
jgi:phosphatidylinositol alpha-mannosyltransferase